MAIKRYLSEENLKRLMKEKEFLIKNVINSEGELQLCLRDNYFNIYYRGNSLAKITFKPEGKYWVEIHSKFVPEAITNDANLENHFIVKDQKYVFKIDKDKLRKLLKKDYIDYIKSKIADVDFKEELEFQHSVMIDNTLNERYCLIDIQVTDECFQGKRMDLIALKHIEENIYRIVVCEVKLGNNKELSDSVYYQINGYCNHIRKYLKCYKDTYEKQYSQLKGLGLFPAHNSKTIVIENEIEEMIIVGRYLVSAKKQIDTLVQNHPDIKDKVKLLKYEL